MATVITVSRQFGSGGRLVGKLLAEKLGIPFYDKEIIDQAAEKSGFATDYIKENEQKIKSLNNYAFGYNFMGGSIWNNFENIENKIYSFEASVIKELAAKGPCVIVGRCADYVLRDICPTLDVFVHADMDVRVQRIKEVYNLLDDAKKAEKAVRQMDKMRAKHYMFYTDSTWGESDNYDLTIDSGKFGIEKTADIIANIYNQIKD